MSLGTRIAGLAAAVSVIALASAASATTTVWTYSGPVADGTGNASASLTTGASSLTVDLTNLLANPISDGREISGISFTLDSLPTGVSLFSSSGTLINIAKGGAVTASGATIDHWGTGISGGVVYLDAVGLFNPGGPPHDLIIGPAGAGGLYSAANPSITGKNPHIQGTGDFVLDFTGLSGPFSVTGVQIAFGTGTDPMDFHKATCVSGPCPGVVTHGVPEPATWAMMIVGFGGVGATVRRRRRVAFA